MTKSAISNAQLISSDATSVTYTFTPNGGKRSQYKTLGAHEFMAQVLQHALPQGFKRIRYFGWLAHRRRGALLPLCRTLLAVEPLPVPATPAATPILWLCPCCQGPMRVIERLTAQQLREEVHLDSS